MSANLSSVIQDSSLLDGGVTTNFGRASPSRARVFPLPTPSVRGHGLTLRHVSHLYSLFLFLMAYSLIQAENIVFVLQPLTH